MRLSSEAVALLAAAGMATASDSDPPEGLDPVANMCQRWNHQSVIKGNTLYIDGGYETFTTNNTAGTPYAPVIMGENNYLIKIDMSQTWDWSKNISESWVTKNPNPSTGTPPPQVVRGALFAGPSNDSNIYLYGGTSPMMNQSFPGYERPGLAQYTLWSYDTDGGSWDQYDTSLTTPERPNAGASAEAPDQGLAFFFNGQVDNGTSLYSPTAMQNMTQFLEGMAVIDLVSQTTRNVSTASATGSAPYSHAQAVYVPHIGTKGILVVLGGSYMDAETQEPDDLGTLVAMDEVLVLDIASLYGGGTGTWYKQKTSGTAPQPRVDHCAVAVSPADNSSTQISVYGGRNDTAMIDDLMALSLPSFRWTQLYSGQSPRWGHTCHVAGNRQMVTVGGSLQPPADISWGCDWETKSAAVWDMSIRQWGSVFRADAAPYEVPDLVQEDIGDGAAAPDAGWAPGLDAVFAAARDYSGSLPAPASVQGAGGLGTGEIAAVAAAAVAPVVVVGLACVLVRLLRRRRRRGTAADDQRPQTPAEIEGYEVQEKDSDWPSGGSGLVPAKTRWDDRERIRATNASPVELESPDARTAGSLDSNDGARRPRSGWSVF